MVTTPNLNNDEANLALLNISTGQITNYCVKGISPNGFTLAQPIWSPDGTQLLVISPDPKDKGSKITVVVDIVRGYAATIIKGDIDPVGWMTTEP
jgi:hypothetical protein